MAIFRPACFVAGIVAAGLTLHGQSPSDASALRFDVASVKPTPADSDMAGLIVHMPGEVGYRGTNMPLITYIRVAYQLRLDQISAPDWVNSSNFDVEAKAEKPSAPDELHLMLQHLLEERFHMKLRRETKEQPGYVLVVDKGGPKLQDHDPEDKVTMPIQGFGKHVGTNVTMQYFAFYLSGELGRTVVDKTGLTGHYDFEATWWPDPSTGDAPMPAPPSAGGGDAQTALQLRPSIPSGPGLIEALKQQLGLRLDQSKVPVERLVIEHIEPLTEN